MEKQLLNNKVILLKPTLNTHSANKSFHPIKNKQLKAKREENNKDIFSGFIIW